MNRRTFLKSIATACGAAVVCPGELLKSPVAGIDPSKPVEWIATSEKTRWPKYHVEHNLTSEQRGITMEQLKELVRMTLEDLPKPVFPNGLFV